MLGMSVLIWIAHTRRPFSVEELRQGLAVEYDGEEPDNELDPANLLSPRSLVDVCAGLVVTYPKWSSPARQLHPQYCKGIESRVGLLVVLCIV